MRLSEMGRHHDLVVECRERQLDDRAWGSQNEWGDLLRRFSATGGTERSVSNLRPGSCVATCRHARERREGSHVRTLFPLIPTSCIP